MNESILDAPDSQLGLSVTAEKHLRIAAKWAYFLAIFGFIMIGLVILVVVGLGEKMRAIMHWANGGMLLWVVLLLYVLMLGMPTWFLFQFSTKTKSGLSGKNPNNLARGLQYLRYFFTFSGVMTILYICFIFYSIGKGLMQFSTMGGI